MFLIDQEETRLSGKFHHRTFLLNPCSPANGSSHHLVCDETIELPIPFSWINQKLNEDFVSVHDESAHYVKFRY